MRPSDGLGVLGLTGLGVMEPLHSTKWLHMVTACWYGSEVGTVIRCEKADKRVELELAAAVKPQAKPNPLVFWLVTALTGRGEAAQRSSEGKAPGRATRPVSVGVEWEGKIILN